MKRIVMVLCVVALIFGVANLAVFAKEAAAATNSTENYDSLQAAVDDYISGVIVMEADAQDLTVDRDVYLDLNGHFVENVNVTGGTLYCMDSETDDYTVEDGVYGKLTGTITGNVAGVPQEAACAEHGYLKVTEADGISFHCVNLKIYAMSLRATEVGVYYKSYFSGDELVAQNVQNFGVALSVVAEPNGANLERYCGYSVFTKFLAGKDANSAKATGTLLRDIMKTANTDRVNTRNSGMPVYGRAYIKTADGYMFGATVNRNLKQQVEAVNDKWDELSSTQKASVTAMYRDYKVVMHDTWDIPNIIYAEKFEKAITAQDSYVTGSTVTIGELFAATEVGKAEETKIVSESVQVVVAPAGPEDDARGIYEANVTDWTKGTLQMFGLGTAKITITDNCYCKPMTIEVAIIDPQPEDKFTANSIETQITGSAVTMGQLFVPIQGVDIDAENIVVTVGTQTVANGPAWADALYTFETAGEYVFAITDNDYCIPASVTVTVEDPKPVDKFAPVSAVVAYAGQPIALGDLFGAIDGISINSATVTVTISGGTYTKNEADWKQSTLAFDAAGTYTVEITDNELCNTATNTVTVNLIDAFEIAFKNANKYLFRVGNQSEFNISKLFKLTDVSKYNLGAISITFKNKQTGETLQVAEVNQNTFAAAKTAFEKTFTGIVEVTISSKYANAVTLNLEAVNAVNATSATSATANNVVLLNDIDFGTVKVSGGYTLYGNGFTMTCSSDLAARDAAYGFVTLENGTLDNVQIICPRFSHAILYQKNYSENNNPTDPDGRYYNIRSAVLADGKSKIVNSYVSGGRAAVYASSGSLIIDNSTIEGGAAANVHTGTCALTLKDVTLIQTPRKATTNGPSAPAADKILMGLSVLAMCDGNGLCVPITLEGTLTQYAWAHAGYAEYVPSDGKALISMALKKSDYIHKITYTEGEAAKDSLSLGFVFMPAEAAAAKDPVVNNMIIDRRTDKTNKPYGATDINGAAYVYSCLNTNGTASDIAFKPGYSAATQDPSLPDVVFAATDDACVYSTKYDTITGSWTYTLNIDLDQGDYSFDFANLLAQKYGKPLAYTVATDNGVAVDKNAPIVLKESGERVYVLTIKDEQLYDQNGEKMEGTFVERTCIFRLVTSKTSIPAPVWYGDNKLTGTDYVVGDDPGSNSDWNCAVSVMEGLAVQYWSKTENKLKVLEFKDITFGTKGKQNSTNNNITIKKDGEYTLVISTVGFKSNPKDDGMPVVANNTLFFTVTTSSNYVSRGSGSRDIDITYKFTDANNPDVVLQQTIRKTVVCGTTKAKEYSDFCNGTIKDAECIAAGTLITLADGTQVPVEELTGTEELLVWNLETGSYDSAPIVFVDSDAQTEYEIVHLYFSDGTDVEVIAEHGFFDTTLGKYVYLDASNADDYIGHSFIKQGNIAEGTWQTVELTDVVIETKVTTAYSPVTFSHLCYYVDGMLSMPGGIEGLFNIFQVNTDTMVYDAEKKAEDIENYGLFIYEDFADVIPEEAFYAFNGAYLKVAIGKGLLVWEDIEYLAQRYVPLM